jgi:serine/threonine protein kinase
MPALFRIVQDDCPPIPDGASPIVKDFLYHCFQKDSNLRISAKKLLKHPWMISARKQLSEGKSRVGSNTEPKEGPQGAKKPHNYNFDEALAKVQEWNEALKCALSTVSRIGKMVLIDLIAPSRPSKHPARNPRPTSPLLRMQDAPLSSSLLGSPAGRPGPSAKTPAVKGAALGLADKINPFVLQANEEQTDNWDDDFEEGISFNKLQGVIGYNFTVVLLTLVI